MLYNALGQMRAKSLGVGKHPDGQGLWLVKRNLSAGKWILRLSIKGKRREMGLGRWPDVSIAEARERAAGARKQLRDGLDPIEMRSKERNAPKAVTLAEAVHGCFEAKQAELKNDGKSGRWMSPLKIHILPKLGEMPIEDIDQHILKSTLEPIWHKKPEASRKAMNRLNLALKHAAALGLEVDLQATMKAKALLGKQRHIATHIPSLRYQDAPKFYQWLCSHEAPAALALRFLMLTIARTSEVRLATFDEIEGDVWTLKPERTKSAREHRVPLSNEATRVVDIARAKSGNEHLFPSFGGKPMSDMAMSTFMKREGYEARPHGFRATFRTWVEEQTETAFEVKESVLGHHVDAGVVGAYQRSDRLDKRRKLMQKWANFLR